VAPGHFSKRNASPAQSGSRDLLKKILGVKAKPESKPKSKR
jgi:hypothetical protein